MKLETEKTEKETQLEHNLFRKREQLEAELAEVSEQDLSERLREAQEELKEVSELLACTQEIHSVRLTLALHKRRTCYRHSASQLKAIGPFV